MATHAISTHKLKVVTELNVVTENEASESRTPGTLKQRLGTWLRDVFEGHEEYLGVTHD
ncbi:MAG: hypothetical protein WB762_10020 [Candidatus Sulfotelmatobacter sp.]